MLLSSRKTTSGALSPGFRPPLAEALEPRRLLSATWATSTATDGVVRPASSHVRVPRASGSTTIDGFTPAQIRKAYGFDQAVVGNGGVPADGRGQTIAIVVAFDYPSIVADLRVFDAHFGLPDPPSLRVVNQTGGTKLPRVDSGWASETALDVQWAHAIAPMANVLVVEANSASNEDLVAAIDAARSTPGVSAVSMSWGGGEFTAFGGREFTGQTDFDPHFTTPAGHAGVTFVAAAGDQGRSGGSEWPASAAGVLSVGGTTLNIAGDGTYLKETVWSGTSGGYSTVEPEPDYQRAAQNTGARSVPDVAYAGDPNTGFAVYDSIPDAGFVGWQVEGGNSAGTPQWAALVAIANQGRALAGKAPLDGQAQTLPALYALYDSSGPAGAAAYAGGFTDVVDATGGRVPATAGYDSATGLGTPKAAALIAALAGAADLPPTPTSPNPAPTLPASPLAALFLTTPPASVTNGTSGSVKVRLTNPGAATFKGAASITLRASTDDVASADDAFVATVPVRRFALRGGGAQSKKVKVKFRYPQGLNGIYELIASIDATGTNTAAAVAVSPTPVAVAPASAKLAASFGSSLAIQVRPGHSADATLLLRNLGTATSSSRIGVTLYASPTPSLGASPRLLMTLPARKTTLKPGRSKRVKLRFITPADELGGTFYLVASVVSSQPVTRVAAISTTPR